MPFLNEQIQILQAIASIRNSFLDPIFIFLNYLDTEYFVMVLIPFVWVAISPRWGLRLAFLLIVNSVFNDELKYLFDLPRPIVMFPDLAMFPFRSPGFPSNGAEGATLLGGLLIYAWKSPWAWPIGIGYAALISFSRLYLYVHYPMDVIGGIIFGLLLLFAFIYSIHPIERFVAKKPELALGIATLICLSYALIDHDSFSFRMAGGAIGFSIGAYLFYSLHLEGKLRFPILGAIFTILVVFALFLLTKHWIPHGIQSFGIALWISLGAIPVWRFLMNRQS